MNEQMEKAMAALDGIEGAEEPSTCHHESFEASCHVRKVNNFGKDEWSLEVTLRCSGCGSKFVFPGGWERHFVEVWPGSGVP